MARVTGGSFPAEAWHNFMVAAHDTDNIPTIPGLPAHPAQIAEQKRLERMQQAAAADSNIIMPAAPPESVRDMSSATRMVLEKISRLLSRAPSLSPSDDRAQTRAPESDEPKPSVADIEGDQAESVKDHPVDQKSRFDVCFGSLADILDCMKNRRSRYVPIADMNPASG